MLNAGVLAFDAGGSIKALSIADFPNPWFNGGTPTGDIGSLVVAPYTSGYNPEVRLAGIPYTNTGGIVIDAIGAIASYAGGLPLTANGLAVAMDSVVVRWVNGIPLDATGRVCLATPTAGSFSPSELFAAGEQGAWYDPSDFSTMFQDSAGTTPVTAVGQTVGKILDKSGRGNHASQATTSKRPVLQQDAGGKYYLGFDGVDDFLGANSIAFSGKYVNSCMGVYVHNTSPGFFYETSIVANTNPGAFNSYCNDASTGGIVARAYGGSGVTGPSEVAVAVPNTSVYSIDYNFLRTNGSQAIYIRRNGAAYSNGGTWVAGGDFTTQPLYLGMRGGSSYPFNGRIYSLIIRNALSTTQEITATEAWVNSKTGAY